MAKRFVNASLGSNGASTPHCFEILMLCKFTRTVFNKDQTQWLSRYLVCGRISLVRLWFGADFSRMNTAFDQFGIIGDLIPLISFIPHDSVAEAIEADRHIFGCGPDAPNTEWGMSFNTELIEGIMRKGQR